MCCPIGYGVRDSKDISGLIKFNSTTYLLDELTLVSVFKRRAVIKNGCIISLKMKPIKNSGNILTLDRSHKPVLRYCPRI